MFKALASNAPHIPYRNSKLTHVLQDSLGGDSKTCVFINCRFGFAPSFFSSPSPLPPAPFPPPFPHPPCHLLPFYLTFSPLSTNLAETLCTINFGRNIRKIELGPASKHKGAPLPPKRK